MMEQEPPRNDQLLVTLLIVMSNTAFKHAAFTAMLRAPHLSSFHTTHQTGLMPAGRGTFAAQGCCPIFEREILQVRGAYGASSHGYNILFNNGD